MARTASLKTVQLYVMAAALTSVCAPNREPPIPLASHLRPDAAANAAWAPVPTGLRVAPYFTAGSERPVPDRPPALVSMQDLRLPGERCPSLARPDDELAFLGAEACRPQAHTAAAVGLPAFPPPLPPQLAGPPDTSVSPLRFFRAPAHIADADTPTTAGAAPIERLAPETDPAGLPDTAQDARVDRALVHAGPLLTPQHDPIAPQLLTQYAVGLTALWGIGWCTRRRPVRPPGSRPPSCAPAGTGRIPRPRAAFASSSAGW